MGTHNQNGRGVTGPGNGMRGPGWRPQDQHDDEFGQGQSGYGAGRTEGDRYGRWDGPERGMGTDERFARGREDEYWLDRGDRPNPPWEQRDRDGERHPRDRMGYGAPRQMQTGYGNPPGNPGNREARSWNPDEDRFDRGSSRSTAPTGMHRGKGPLNYMRSDERIREQICEALTDDHHVDASHIDVVVKNGEVTLSGTVEDRRQKRLAEDIAERCGGVKDISNQLKIGNNPTSAAGSKQDKSRA